jgi:hypothetical protein
MHICDRWILPGATSPLCGTWEMDFEQRKICTSVIDGSRRMLSLLRKLRESGGTGHGQEVSVGHDWHVDRK